MNAKFNVQNVKIKHYDFAIKECLGYLAKPLKIYQDWMDEPGKVDEFSGFKKPTPGASATTTTAATPKSNTLKVHIKDKKTEEPKLSMVEIETIEYMRLSYNFLTNCVKNVQTIDDGSYQMPVPDFSDEMVDLPKLLESNSFDDMTTELRLSTLDLLPPLPSKLTLKKSESVASSINEMDQPHLLVSPNMLQELHANNPELQQDLQIYCDRITLLEKKNLELYNMVNKERRARRACQLAKQLVDKEIEEITAEVFARANQMVIDESIKMQQLQQKCRELKKELDSTSELLKEKQMQLQYSMKVIYGYETSTIVLEMPISQGSEATSPVTMDYAHSIISGFDLFESDVAGDGIIFSEFQDFVRTIILTGHTPDAQTSIHNTLFMKRCMMESVEPTLYYSYSKKSSLPQWARKRFLDNSIKGSVSITHLKQEKPVVPIQKSKCCCCSLVRECEYKLSIPDYKFDSSFCCRFCRDRILSVQDFFEFVSCLAGNPKMQSATILSTFKKCMWLRRRMALSLVGSCSMFETEVSAVVGASTTTSWEQNCDIKY